MVFQTKKGSPAPLGAWHKEEGINFAFYSASAKKVALCLFKKGKKKPFLELNLKPSTNKTGPIWHVFIPKEDLNKLYSGAQASFLKNHHFFNLLTRKYFPVSKFSLFLKQCRNIVSTVMIRFFPKLSEKFEYAYRVDRGPFVCDPYAKALNTSCSWGIKQKSFETGRLRGRILPNGNFNWEEDAPPNIPIERLLIYEMHVRAFTQDSSSGAKNPGTFLGVIEKIPYLKKLGINAVELLPVQEFNECEYDRINPFTCSPLCNFWGYSTVNFFTPMQRYATGNGWDMARRDFKTMVKAFHRAGIEVILDVVYNHTSEGNEQGPIHSFRGADPASYYMRTEKGEYKNYSGCGNTFNCNHKGAKELIVDSLRFWVEEMHVDGFRFDLASILTRGVDGTPLSHPPVIETITRDPLLSKVKLIAEAWDGGGLYQVGSFPGGGKWAEWNGIYRDTVRRFLKGAPDQSKGFSDALLGSPNVYKHYRGPAASINFVTAHDGFTLHDLVTYQDKHNLANGEENRDGSNWNDNWNCGAEGPTKDHKIVALRHRQMRNHALALLFSLGTPMILMGDEYGHTRQGNNNAWSQDNDLNWFQWNEVKKNRGFWRFFSHLIALRKSLPHFTRSLFLNPSEVEWLAQETHFVAYILKSPYPLLIAFNASNNEVVLPLPKSKVTWHHLVNTALHSPHDIAANLNTLTPLNESITLLPYSAVVARETL